MTTNRNLTGPSTAALLLPTVISASTSMGPGQMEDASEQYRQRAPNQDLNRTCAQTPLAFSPSQSLSLASPPGLSPHSYPQPQSQSQPQSHQPLSQSQSALDAPDCGLFLPQRNERWSRDGADQFQDRTLSPHVQSPIQGSSQSQSQGQQGQQSRQEAFAQIMEYHRGGLIRSMGDGGDDGSGDMDRTRDGDEREEKGRSSDTELDLGGGGRDRTGVGQGCTSSSGTRRQQTFRQPTVSSGPSSSIMMNMPFGEEDDSPLPLPSSSSSSSSSLVNEGLQVYTVGHLMPRNTNDVSGNWNFDANGLGGGGGDERESGVVNASLEGLGNVAYGLAANGRDGNEDEEDFEIIPPPGPHTVPSTSTTIIECTSSDSPPPPPPPPPSSSSSSPQKLRVRRATFVPGGWAVPPRVLLVDDDAVTRKLSSQFLKIFGCTTDVAVDGIGAVTKMNLEKYDLVLMVRFVSSFFFFLFFFFFFFLDADCGNTFRIF